MIPPGVDSRAIATSAAGVRAWLPRGLPGLLPADRATRGHHHELSTPARRPDLRTKQGHIRGFGPGSLSETGRRVFATPDAVLRGRRVLVGPGGAAPGAMT